MCKLNLNKEKESKMGPNNIKMSEDDDRIIAEILDSHRYIVRYLREAPTVGYARKPARNEEGNVMDDAPWVSTRVICSGVPFACLIAFKRGGKLFVGWSKRLDAKKLISPEEMRKVFDDLIKSTRDADGPDKFDTFSNNLLKLLTEHKPVDVEIPFSKAVGKSMAIIRGLRDTVMIDSKEIKSKVSGHLPNSIRRALPDFIKQAREAFNLPVTNVTEIHVVMDEVA